MDFGSMAKKAQDALGEGADKLEKLAKDNAATIEGAVDKAGKFAKDKFPAQAARIEQATTKAKGVVPRHEQGDTPAAPPAAPPAASATPEVDRTAAEAAGADGTTPSSAGYAPPDSATPEVDRIARDQG